MIKISRMTKMCRFHKSNKSLLVFEFKTKFGLSLIICLHDLYQINLDVSIHQSLLLFLLILSIQELSVLKQNRSFDLLSFSLFGLSHI